MAQFLIGNHPMRMLTLAARILRLWDSSFPCNPNMGICQLSPLEADKHLSCLKIPSILTKTTATANREVDDAMKSMQKELFLKGKTALFAFLLFDHSPHCVLCSPSVAWQSMTKSGELRLNYRTFCCWTSLTVLEANLWYLISLLFPSFLHSAQFTYSRLPGTKATWAIQNKIATLRVWSKREYNLGLPMNQASMPS